MASHPKQGEPGEEAQTPAPRPLLARDRKTATGPERGRGSPSCLAGPARHPRHPSKRGNRAASSGRWPPLQMRQFGGLGQASLRRVVGREICVGGMRVTRSVVVIAGNLRGATVVHAG